MIIQHNMLASNANRQFNDVSEKKAKFADKLSSGYQINRASDNAAGLLISERMRSQIRGLDQASKNVQDGLSLIQTADGALSEVHSLLQRIRELSVGAANDTNVDVDRSAIQEEIDALTNGIDNIANETEFNRKKILDGSCSDSGLSQAEKDKFMSWLNGSWLNDAALKIESTTGWTLEPDTTVSVSFKNIGGSAVATMSGWFLGDDLTLTLNTEFLTNGMAYNGTDGPTTGGIPADRLITHEMTHGYMFDNVSVAAIPDNWFVEGLAEAVHGATDIRYGAFEGNYINNFALINQDIQDFDFIGNSNSTDIFSVGQIAVGYLYNKIGEGNFKSMLAEMDQSDESFRALVTKYTGASSFNAFINEFKTDAQTAMDASNFDSAFLAVKCGIDITDGDADPLKGPDASSSNVIPNSGSAVAPASSNTTLTVGSSTVNVIWDATAGNGGIVLQIGANSGQSMTVSIEAATSASLRIDNLSVSNYTNAKNAITSCDSAISNVSGIRTKLGAYQNRLEHTMSNLDNISENTQSAESRIRDVNMAKAMVEFSKLNVLAQAGQAMISQANQNPEGILALLQ